MLKKLISSRSGVLSKMEMQNIKGGISPAMAACVPGSWGCYSPAYCRSTCGVAFCCNDCLSSCSEV